MLLHGALGAGDSFDPLIPHLDDHFFLHILTFEGHGTHPPIDSPFSIERFANQIAHTQDRFSLGKLDLFGYSLGGYVALYLAATQPERVGRVFTLGTRFFWTPDDAIREATPLQPGGQAMWPATFWQMLEARHKGPGIEDVLRKTAAMLIRLGSHDPLDEGILGKIKEKVRIGVGDKDRTATLEHSIRAFRALPHAELEVFPDTSHPLERVDMMRLAGSIKGFFSD
jgi:pimeloyl-ACP methyl ester carboxylesterase